MSDKAELRTVCVLIAPGFNESLVTECLVAFRSASLRTLLVGVVVADIRGAHGLTVRPDISLDRALRLFVRSGPSLTVVPGPSDCAEALISDPRVHRLLQITVQTGGLVALGEEAEKVVETALPGRLGRRQSVVKAGRLGVEGYVALLVELQKDPVRPPLPEQRLGG